MMELNYDEVYDWCILNNATIEDKRALFKAALENLMEWLPKEDIKDYIDSFGKEDLEKLQLILKQKS